MRHRRRHSSWDATVAKKRRSLRTFEGATKVRREWYRFPCMILCQPPWRTRGESYILHFLQLKENHRSVYDKDAAVSKFC